MSLDLVVGCVKSHIHGFRARCVSCSDTVSCFQSDVASTMSVGKCRMASHVACVMLGVAVGLLLGPLLTWRQSGPRTLGALLDIDLDDLNAVECDVATEPENGKAGRRLSEVIRVAEQLPLGQPRSEKVRRFVTSLLDARPITGASDEADGRFTFLLKNGSRTTIRIHQPGYISCEREGKTYEFLFDSYYVYGYMQGAAARRAR